MERNRLTAFFEGTICILGVWIFALCINRESIFQYTAYGGLLLAAIVISRSIHNLSSLLSLFGITPFNRKVLFYVLAGIAFGGLLAILCNYLSEDNILPVHLKKFALIAPLIGITEELVFRGYVQTKMAAIGSLLSIGIASTGHTMYKYLVIKTLPDDLRVNYFLLILLTFIVGVVFGILRDRSKSVLPAASAHALFDVIVYGGIVMAPVWVWT